MKDDNRLITILNTIADWILRIILINIMMIIMMIPIITIIPALSAGYNMFRDYFDYEDPPIFKGYFGYLRKHFLKKLKLSLFLIFLAILGITNTRYYMGRLEADETLFNLIGYYISLILLVALGVVTLYSLCVKRVYPRLKLSLHFKVSFMLAGKFFFRTILLVLSLFLPLGLLLTQFTLVLFIFSGMSLLIMLNVYITTPAVEYLEKIGENND